MPTLDVNVSADLQKLFELPACADIKLPPPEKLEITLPTGGSLKAIADISKGIPNDCSLIVSLMLQIAPFLASIECLFKLLGLIAPLIDVVKALAPTPISLSWASAVPKFLEAAEKLMPCLLVVTGAPIIPFLRDLLCLILKVLHCLMGQLESIIDIMSGLTLRINIAKASGNTELQQALECAQENAAISAQHMTNFYRAHQYHTTTGRTAHGLGRACHRFNSPLSAARPIFSRSSRQCRPSRKSRGSYRKW